MANLRRGVELIDALRNRVGGIAKRALKEYPTVPLSSLTARSDYVANEQYAPKPPNPLTSEERAVLEALYQGMSRSRARIVDAHKRGRTTPVT